MCLFPNAMLDDVAAIDDHGFSRDGDSVQLLSSGRGRDNDNVNDDNDNNGDGADNDNANNDNDMDGDDNDVSDADVLRAYCAYLGGIIFVIAGTGTICPCGNHPLALFGDLGS